MKQPRRFLWAMLLAVVLSLVVLPVAAAAVMASFIVLVDTGAWVALLVVALLAAFPFQRCILG